MYKTGSVTSLKFHRVKVSTPAEQSAFMYSGADLKATGNGRN